MIFIPEFSRHWLLEIKLELFLTLGVSPIHFNTS